MLVPAALAPIAVVLLWLYLSRTHIGLALRAVAYEERALQISGVDPAAVLYDAVTQELRRLGARLETGRFGADMKVALVNDGPVTIILDL